MVDTEWPAAGSVDTILSQYGPLFERRRAEVAQRRVPQPLPLGVMNVDSAKSAVRPLMCRFLVAGMTRLTAR